LHDFSWWRSYKNRSLFTTDAGNKCDNKPRFSIRGSGFVASNVKSGNLDDGEQEVSSGMPPAKALETMMAEQVENIDEEIEDLPSDFAHPTKNENISVAELLEDLQDRSGSSVRTPFPVCIFFISFLIWSS
jgi:hypothetical protein